MTTHNPDHTARSTYIAPFKDYKPSERLAHCLRPGETLEEKRMSEIPKGVSVPLKERTNTKAGEVTKGPAISLPAKPPVPQTAVGNDGAPFYVQAARLVHAHGPDCSLTWLAEQLGLSEDPEGRQRVGNAMKTSKRHGYTVPSKPGYWSPDAPVDWTPEAPKPGPEKFSKAEVDKLIADEPEPPWSDALEVEAFYRWKALHCTQELDCRPGQIPSDDADPVPLVVMESKEDLARKYGIAHRSSQESGWRPGRPVAEWSPQAKTFMYLEPKGEYEARVERLAAARIVALCSYIIKKARDRLNVDFPVMDELSALLHKGFKEPKA